MATLFEDEPKRKARPTKAQVEAIYELYPRQVGKKKAHESILRALRLVKYKKLASVVQYYAECQRANIENGTTDKRFIPHPATWFNQGRWDDDPSEWVIQIPENDKRRVYEEQKKAHDSTVADEREQRAAGEIQYWREREPELLADAEKRWPDRYRQVTWITQERAKRREG